jgi:hypothetical protein
MIYNTILGFAPHGCRIEQMVVLLHIYGKPKIRHYWTDTPIHVYTIEVASSLEREPDAMVMHYSSGLFQSLLRYQGLW